MLRPVVLASASPRRRELLAAAGWVVDLAPAALDETALPGEAPLATCERLARQKADAGAVGRRRGAVLGADTVVVLAGELLGKPADRSEAGAMLRRLSGRTHAVASASAWHHVESGRVVSGVHVSEVRFDTLDGGTIAAYLDGGEWRDKAGGYALQGEASAFARLVRGRRDTVIGLSLALVDELAQRLVAELES